MLYFSYKETSQNEVITGDTSLKLGEQSLSVLFLLLKDMEY